MRTDAETLRTAKLNHKLHDEDLNYYSTDIKIWQKYSLWRAIAGLIEIFLAQIHVYSSLSYLVFPKNALNLNISASFFSSLQLKYKLEYWLPCDMFHRRKPPQGDPYLHQCRSVLSHCSKSFRVRYIFSCKILTLSHSLTESISVFLYLLCLIHSTAEILLYYKILNSLTWHNELG